MSIQQPKDLFTNLSENILEQTTPAPVSFMEFYERRIREAYLNNITETKITAQLALSGERNRDTENLCHKIREHLRRTGIPITLDAALSFLTEDTPQRLMIASFLTKDPTKQNQSEKSQLEFLLEYRGIALESLPATGSRAQRLDKLTGEFVSSSKHEGTMTHSFDYRYHGPRWIDWIMCKVTTTQGGGQKQQREEMLNMFPVIEQYCRKHDTPERFVFMLDGDNYTKTGSGKGLDAFVEHRAASAFPDRILITNCEAYDPTSI